MFYSLSVGQTFRFQAQNPPRIVNDVFTAVFPVPSLTFENGFQLDNLTPSGIVSVRHGVQPARSLHPAVGLHAAAPVDERPGRGGGLRRNQGGQAPAPRHYQQLDAWPWSDPAAAAVPGIRYVLCQRSANDFDLPRAAAQGGQALLSHACPTRSASGSTRGPRRSAGAATRVPWLKRNPVVGGWQLAGISSISPRSGWRATACSSAGSYSTCSITRISAFRT